MDRTASSSRGIARTYALVFGLTYIAVALIEDILGSKGLKFGDTTILKVTALQNVVHWAVGLGVLGSYFAGEAASKMVARIVGVVFVLLTVLGVFARSFTGDLLGFHGPLPWSYNIVHLLTAAAALFAGFAASRVYGSASNIRRAA